MHLCQNVCKCLQNLAKLVAKGNIMVLALWVGNFKLVAIAGGCLTMYLVRVALLGLLSALS